MAAGTERIIDKQLKMLRERRKELGESYASHITAAADCRRQQKAIDKEFYAMAAKEKAKEEAQRRTDELPY